MSTLRTLRAQLVDLLDTGDVPAFGHLPARLVPPVRIVEPAEPYVTDEEDYLTVGEYEVGYDVFLIGRSATNPVQVDEIDDQVQAVLDLLDTDPWTVRTVGQPFALTVDERRSFPTVIVRVTTTSTLTTP